MRCRVRRTLPTPTPNPDPDPDPTQGTMTSEVTIPSSRTTMYSTATRSSASWARAPSARHMHMHGTRMACTQHALGTCMACTLHPHHGQGNPSARWSRPSTTGSTYPKSNPKPNPEQVVKAFDYKEQRMVAIKIIRNKKRFHTQALVEVKILMHIKASDQDDSANFVQTRSHFYFRSHLCIAFELLSINLYEFIKNNNFQVWRS